MCVAEGGQMWTGDCRASETHADVIGGSEWPGLVARSSNVRASHWVGRSLLTDVQYAAKAQRVVPREQGERLQDGCAARTWYCATIAMQPRMPVVGPSLACHWRVSMRACVGVLRHVESYGVGLLVIYTEYTHFLWFALSLHLQLWHLAGCSLSCLSLAVSL